MLLRLLQGAVKLLSFLRSVVFFLILQTLGIRNLVAFFLVHFSALVAQLLWHGFAGKLG